MILIKRKDNKMDKNIENNNEELNIEELFDEEEVENWGDENIMIAMAQRACTSGMCDK